MQILEDVPLAPHTTLGIGGTARYLVEADSETAIIQALELARHHRWPVFVLGSGSNILVADSGFPGLVLKIALRGIMTPGPKDSGRIRAAAGEDWDRFVARCVEQGLAGIECLSGIPGSVGATPIQNVGAYGQEAGSVIASLRVLDRRDNNILELSAGDCSFGYRCSIFNTTHRHRYVILSVTFALQANGSALIRHGDLERCFAGSAAPPPLHEVRQAVIQIRRDKGMVLDPRDPDTRSAGSFFRNPIVSSQTADRVEREARRSGLISAEENLPRYRAGLRDWKISAAWLIERAGFPRGYGSKRVGLSRKHALAVVNRGGATAEDVRSLVREIQAGVHETFGVELMPEVLYVGFGPGSEA